LRHVSSSTYQDANKSLKSHKLRVPIKDVFNIFIYDILTFLFLLPLLVSACLARVKESISEVGYTWDNILFITNDYLKNHG
jgi:hypothetical protein